MMTAMLAKNPSRLEGLVAAVIDNAAACIQERVLLQSVDWTKIEPAKVEGMLQRLDAESVRVPNWLAKSLLLAGHSLPAMQTLDAPLHALNHLNKLVGIGRAAEAGIDALVE